MPNFTFTKIWFVEFQCFPLRFLLTNLLSGKVLLPCALLAIYCTYFTVPFFVLFGSLQKLFLSYIHNLLLFFLFIFMQMVSIEHHDRTFFSSTIVQWLVYSQVIDVRFMGLDTLEFSCIHETFCIISRILHLLRYDILSLQNHNTGKLFA